MSDGDVHAKPYIHPNIHPTTYGSPVAEGQPTSQASNLNGRNIAPIKQDSTIKKCAGTFLKFFDELPSSLKLAIGLTLVGVGVVTFIALSPKLLIVAGIVMAVAVFAGLIVIANANPSKNKVVTDSLEKTSYKSKVEKEFIDPLSFVIDNSRLSTGIKNSLQGIKSKLVDFRDTNPLNNQENAEKIDSFREQIVTAIIDQYPGFYEVDFLENLSTIEREKSEYENEILKINALRDWLIIEHSTDANTKEFAPYKKEIIKHIFEAITLHPNRISVEDIRGLLETYRAKLKSSKQKNSDCA